ncbi:hypothetical protein RND81_01G012700 [Saponaria officinalis]|uniref:Uncharacterized protein n=1 Tax=Saponaria officinalis TaxID=3572 RepID=A0AAW1N5H8_SAPOF
MYPVLFDSELSNFSNHQNFVSDMGNGEVFQTNDSNDEQKPNFYYLSESYISSADSVEIPDFSDACIKFLGDILLEEGLDETVQDFKALQATEKSLYDVIGEEYSPTDDHDLVSSLYQSIDNTVDGFDGSFGDVHVNFESKMVENLLSLDPFVRLDDLSDSLFQSSSQSVGCSNSDELKDRVVVSPVSTVTSEMGTMEGKKPVSRSRRKKNRQRDDVGSENGRGNKQQAASNEDYVEMEEYDDVLLCREDKNDGAASCNEAGEKLQKKGSKSRTTVSRKSSNMAEEVDLRTLLNQCAQAVSSFDLRSANEQLKQIRQHSSQYGDSIERVAHYFANALESRIAGTGSTFTSNIVDARISSSESLKAYRVYVQALPFKRVSYFLSNCTIGKTQMAVNAKKVHIIDFGILLGLQWPCLIQALSERSGGPPELRITGIDYPQHGFRPAERVEATGRRLSGYCERFNVPFRYQGIAQKWSSIQPEDLKIESDELVIVNCMYRSGTLLDETVEADSSKDGFLKLVKQLNPHLFVHGVINGTFNAPFFLTRFKEALFHYSALFDVFEATIPREDHARLLIESEMYGKELLNVIACEGAERIQRPESFKQWQTRTLRAGFKQLPLDKEVFKRAKATAKAHYLDDFVVDEDRNWILQGWKGKIFCALSFWQPC